MSVGELWIAHPLFPWIMIVLAGWVGFSTIVMVRNWTQIRKMNSLLETETKIIAKIEVIQDRILKSLGREEKRSSKLCSGKSGIRIEEQPAAAIEETEGDGNNIAITTSEDTERAGVRST